METARLRNFWVSWYTPDSDFKLVFPDGIAWPHWISGSCMDGNVAMCCAVQAESEQHAWNLILSAYGKEKIKFRFSVIKADNWKPYSDRFPQDGQMDWPEIREWKP